MTEWHTWDAVRDELGDSLGSPVEQTQRVEQLRRELALLRLVELRKRSGLRQADVAERMGVSKARVSHIEHGAVATIDLLARYLDAIGGAPGNHSGVRRRHRASRPRLVSSLTTTASHTRQVARASSPARLWITPKKPGRPTPRTRPPRPTATDDLDDEHVGQPRAATTAAG